MPDADVPPTLATRGARLLLRACHGSSDRLCAALVRYSARRLAPSVHTPRHFVYLLLSVEDKRFLLHCGVDPVAAVRAAALNALGRKGLQGASTITQQLFNVGRAEAGIPRRRTLRVKWRQGLWALRYQATHSKAEVLATYLDRVYWGRAYHGLDAAAQGYCRADRSRLTLAQSFFLVERLATPNVVRPHRVARLLRRPSIAPLFARIIGSRAEVLRLYAQHFGAAERIERASAALGR